ncbi:hypothetical protein [Peribacillus kribbensis]|uniref:hypothetical protein n=1 Tax=Peribacillus kribbensis TaxID=356658 RepID=UPI00041F7C66|nr:hypothetical protein [Peribacillus kribbensis]
MKETIVSIMVAASLAVLVLIENAVAGVSLQELIQFILDYSINLGKEDLVSVLGLSTAWLIYAIFSKKTKKQN